MSDPNFSDADLNEAEIEHEIMRREQVKSDRVAAWVTSRFGISMFNSVWERAMRVAEEAIELAQASGVLDVDIYRLIGFIYKKPVGDVVEEAAGVATTLRSYCRVKGVDLRAAEAEALDRMEACPAEISREKHRKKEAADIGKPMVLDGGEIEFTRAQIRALLEYTDLMNGTCESILLIMRRVAKNTAAGVTGPLMEAEELNPLIANVQRAKQLRVDAGLEPELLRAASRNAQKGAEE